MSRRSHRPEGRTGERGAVTVELVWGALPLLVLMLLAALAVGRLVATQLALGGISRDAARVAVTASSATQAVHLARQYAQQAAGGYGLDPAQLTLTVDPGSYARGGTVTVTASYLVTVEPVLTATQSDTHVELIDPYASR